MDKNFIIERICYDPGQHGSLRKTYLAANQKNKTVTEADVKDWYYRNIPPKNDPPGYNSFIANAPQEEYQIDLRFFSDLKDPVYKGGLLMVDAFTKYTVIRPIKNNDGPTLLTALNEAIQKMGGKPKTIFSDDEGGMNSKSYYVT